jgi:hypothetical protein
MVKGLSLAAAAATEREKISKSFLLFEQFSPKL